MKKIIIAISALFFAINVASAQTFKIGISGTGMEFDDAKGTEESKGRTVSETDSLAAAVGSIFVEANIMDIISVGIDYIPYTIEGETVTNTRRSNTGIFIGDNTASVDIDDHITAYVLAPIGDSGVYIKAGYSEAKVNVSENMFRGTTYSDETMIGGHLSIGFEKDMSAFFLRGEAGMSEYGSVESNSSSGATRSKRI